MQQSIVCVTLVVRNYDEAIAYFTQVLQFELLEDAPRENGKRWVMVAPRGGRQMRLLLAEARGAEQTACIGRQTGGRVFLFLHTDDFWRDHTQMIQRGVRFIEEPRTEAYGIVAVFEDLYGNRWDFIQPAAENSINAELLELETLRRTLEAARALDMRIAQARERGWLGEDDSIQAKADQQSARDLAMELEPKLKNLQAQFRERKSTAVKEWIMLHLIVCQSLLNAEIEKPSEPPDTRSQCIGELIAQLGNVLSAQAHTFSIDDYYLADYEAEFDRIAGFSNDAGEF